MTSEPRPKEVIMVRILIPSLLVLCAALAPAAETTTPIVPAVPADAPAVTCPLGNVPGSGQGQGAGQGKGQCLRKRDGSGACQGQGKGKGAGKGQGRRDGSCLKDQAGNG
jgi:hypothetical protein